MRRCRHDVSVCVPIFAQISRWQRLGDGLHRPGSRLGLEELWPILLLVGLVAAGFAGWYYWRQRYDFSARCNDSKKLFRELCRATGSTTFHPVFLLRVAAAAGLKEPAAVFLSPEVFEPQHLPPQFEREAQQLRRLRERLF